MSSPRKRGSSVGKINNPLDSCLRGNDRWDRIFRILVMGLGREARKIIQGTEGARHIRAGTPGLSQNFFRQSMFHAGGGISNCPTFKYSDGLISP